MRVFISMYTGGVSIFMLVLSYGMKFVAGFYYVIQIRKAGERDTTKILGDILFLLFKMLRKTFLKRHHQLDFRKLYSVGYNVYSEVFLPKT